MCHVCSLDFRPPMDRMEQGHNQDAVWRSSQGLMSPFYRIPRLDTEIDCAGLRCRADAHHLLGSQMQPPPKRYAGADD